jgi:hypothetical protein
MGSPLLLVEGFQELFLLTAANVTFFFSYKLDNWGLYSQVQAIPAYIVDGNKTSPVASIANATVVLPFSAPIFQVNIFCVQIPSQGFNVSLGGVMDIVIPSVGTYTNYSFVLDE